MKMKALLAALILSASFASVFSFEDEVPEAPVNLAAATQYKGADAIAVLTWQDESDNEVGFEVFRSDNNGEYRVVAFVGANTGHYEDKVGKYRTGSYAYKVRAFNQSGKSDFSNVAAVWF